jgi:hypothetical protein
VRELRPVPVSLLRSRLVLEALPPRLVLRELLHVLVAQG